MDNNNRRFRHWFQQATGHAPSPFQNRFACELTLPELVDVPTGLGKTAMAVLGWLWRQHTIALDVKTIRALCSYNR